MRKTMALLLVVALLVALMATPAMAATELTTKNTMTTMRVTQGDLVRFVITSDASALAGNVAVEGLEVLDVTGASTPTQISAASVGDGAQLRIAYMCRITAAAGATASFAVTNLMETPDGGAPTPVDGPTWTQEVRETLLQFGRASVDCSAATVKKGDEITIEYSTEAEGLAGDLTVTGLDLISPTDNRWITQDKLTFLPHQGGTTSEVKRVLSAKYRVTAEAGEEVSVRLTNGMEAIYKTEQPCQEELAWKATVSADTPPQEPTALIPKSGSILKLEGTGDERYLCGRTASKDKITVQEIKSQFGELPEGYEIIITDHETGALNSPNATIYTGCRILLEKTTDPHDIIDEAEIVVYGDVMGSWASADSRGVIALAQVVALCKAYTTNPPMSAGKAFSEAQLKAGDLNGSGTISVSDLVASAKLFRLSRVEAGLLTA